MLAYDHARARACMCLLGARKYVHVHDEIILLWRLSTPVLLCVRHIIAYRTLDRKCISLQISISIVMSLFRKQSTQACTNGFFKYWSVLQNSHFANERMTSGYLWLPRVRSNATVHSIFSLPRKRNYTSH